MRTACVLWILGAAPVLAATETPGAAAPAAPVTQFGDWYLRCFEARGGPACNVTHSIILKESRKQVLLLSLAYSPERAQYAMEVLVPLGVDVRRGIDITVGDIAAKSVPVTRCELSGCVVDAILGDELVKAMRSAHSGKVTLGGIAAQDASIEFSLSGFEQADDALRRETIALTALRSAEPSAP
jgi:invasion protein IalB